MRKREAIEPRKIIYKWKLMLSPKQQTILIISLSEIL